MRRTGPLLAKVPQRSCVAFKIRSAHSMFLVFGKLFLVHAFAAGDERSICAQDSPCTATQIFDVFLSTSRMQANEDPQIEAATTEWTIADETSVFEVLKAKGDHCSPGRYDRHD